MSFAQSLRLPVAGLSLSLAVAALLAPADARAFDVSGSAAVTSDYVWRGSSQTTEAPAVQAGIKVAAGNGLYASLWASNVRFTSDADSRLELDGVIGWSAALSDDWSIDANLTRYAYPGSTGDLDWSEGMVTVTWLQNYWLQVAHSGDALGSGESGTYAQAGARIPLGQDWRLEVAAGRYLLDSAVLEDYLHGQLGVVWAFHAPFELRVTGHATDSTAKRLFPGMAGNRVEVAVQGAF